MQATAMKCAHDAKHRPIGVLGFIRARNLAQAGSSPIARILERMDLNAEPNHRCKL